MGARLIWRFFKLNLKALIEYRHEFVLSNLSMLTSNLILFGGIYLATSKLVSLEFYLQGITIFMGAYTLGLAFFTRGLWGLEGKIVEGLLDKYLLRPVDPYILLLIDEVNPFAFGELITWILLLMITPNKLYVLVWSLISALFLHVVTLCYGSLQFFISTNYPIWLKNIAFDTGFYPPRIFPESIRKMIIFAFPGTLISFGPVLALQNPVYYLYYFVAFFVFATLAIIFWRFGLKKYESVGY